MAKSKAQTLKELKASSKYKKASAATKAKLRKQTAAKWESQQVKNFDAGAMAGKYNYSRALLEGTPELLNLFKTAHIKEWSDEKIKAEIENTSWYRTHATKWQEVEETRLKHPGEFDKAVDRSRYAIQVMARQIGADVTPEELNKLASDAVYEGWNESDMRRYVSAEIDIAQTGGLFGEAGQAEMSLRKMANENGVDYPDSWFRDSARNAIKFNSIGDIERQIREDSANTYTPWADAIREGKTTVTKAAGSYLRSLEKTYDMEDGSATVFDPHVRKALTGRDEQGNVAVAPLWKFEEDLRRDPKWLTTNNGAETMAKAAGGILQEWGFLNNG